MGADRSTCRGVLTPSPYPSSLAERTLRRQIPKVGARCVNHARRDLCGGCSAMGIPTAIGLPERPKIIFLDAFVLPPGALDYTGPCAPHCKTPMTTAVHSPASGRMLGLLQDAE